MSLINQLLDAQRRFQLELLAKANVVGVGIGYKNQIEDDANLALVALVEQKLPLAALTDADKIPSEVNGLQTDVIEVGRLQAQLNDGPRDIWRPEIPAGVSIGHPLVTAGTIGALVYDNRSGERLILSNNHVLANSNAAGLFDPILQPAVTDSGDTDNHIVAELYRYLPIQYIGDSNVPPDVIEPAPGQPGPIPDPEPNPPAPPPTTPPPTNEGCANLIISLGNMLARLNDPEAEVVITRSQAQQTTFDPIERTTLDAQQVIPENSIDAALARPLDDDTIRFSDEILSIGRVSGVKPPVVGMRVRKMGRTTGLTTGEITVVNAVVDVGYNTPLGRRTARFTDQVMATGMSQGGDSGALVMDADSQQAVGLLFAGSGITTVFTPIQRVLERLQVTLTPPQG